MKDEKKNVPVGDRPEDKCPECRDPLGETVVTFYALPWLFCSEPCAREYVEGKP